VQSVLDEELARFITDPPTAAELRKAKNQLQADCFRRLKTTEGRADMLGLHEMLFSDHRALFDTPARFEAVTIDDLVRVASVVLRQDNRTTAWLDPIDEASPDDAATDGVAP
jgi:zinc protease